MKLFNYCGFLLFLLVATFLMLFQESSLAWPTPSREIQVSAKLLPTALPPEKSYEISLSMQTSAGGSATKRYLTSYQNYPQLVPYIEKAIFDPKTQKLDLEGGVWNYRLRSVLQFNEVSENKILIQVIEGHFKGFQGELRFEKADRGTWVHFQGKVRGTLWPPAFVMERGAEMVFAFSASAVRAKLEESLQELGKGNPNDIRHQFPQPQKRLKF